MFKIIRKIFIHLVKFRIKSVTGIKNIPKQGPIIFVTNHVGQQDPVLLYSLLIRETGQQIYSIAKWPSLSGKFGQKYLGTIPIYENKQKSIAHSIKILKNKGQLLIFPEGGVNLTNQINKVKTGAIRIALQAKVPIIPIGLIRSNRPPKNEFQHTLDIFFGGLKISIGSLIYLNPWYNKTIDKDLLKEANLLVMSKVAALANKQYIGY